MIAGHKDELFFVLLPLFLAELVWAFISGSPTSFIL
jgi:hypothetical protein